MFTFREILRPNGNLTSNWFIFDFNNINKPVKDPGVPDLSTAVVAKDTDLSVVSYMQFYKIGRYQLIEFLG